MTDPNALLPQITAEFAETKPDDLAIVDLGGQRMTFRQLHEENLRFATVLDDAGVCALDYVATLVPNSIAAYNVWLGVSWLGAIEAPVNPALRGPLLRHNLNASKARHVVISSEFLPQLLEVADGVPDVRAVIVLDADQPPDLPWHAIAAKPLLAAATPATGLNGPQPWDTYAVIFTSGTSGAAKPVLPPWGAVPAALDTPALNDPSGPDEGFYGSFPAFHASGKASLEIAIRDGGYLVMREKFSPTRFLDDVRKNNVTGALLIGAMAQFLLNQPERPDDAETSLQRVILNPIPPAADEFRARFGVQVSTLYGMSECMRVCASPGYEPMPPGACGKVIDDRLGVEARIVDEYERELPNGQVGELIARFSQPWTMFKGYLGMPEATLTAMRNGWYHSGDALRRDDDGYFYFVDRIKDAIRRRGENISSFEVEVMVNEHPLVAESAAVGLPSEEAHHEDELKVFVILREEGAVTAQDLHDFLRKTMPKFMLPRYLEIVSELPRTVTQKVQKAALRAMGVTEHTWDSTIHGVVHTEESELDTVIREQQRDNAHPTS